MITYDLPNDNLIKFTDEGMVISKDIEKYLLNGKLSFEGFTILQLISLYKHVQNNAPTFYELHTSSGGVKSKIKKELSKLISDRFVVEVKI